MAAPQVERSFVLPLASCRMCGAGGLRAVLTLAPPGDSLAATTESSADQPGVPLILNRCSACGHVQLAELVDRIRILGQPVPAIGADPRLRQASEAQARQLIARLSPARDALIVGIGSNDGTILKPFEDAGCRVQGIEPAANVAGAAIAAGVPTHPGLFSPAIAEKIEEERGRAALIFSGQAFAEAGDPAAWMEGVRLLLRRDGVFAFCVDGLASLFENARIDRITHRTIDYHAIAPLKRFLAASDLHLFAAERRPGGALFGLAQRFGGPHAPDAALDALILAEQAAGIADDAGFARLAARLAEARGLR